MVMVVSGEQVEAVISEPGGLLETMHGGVILVHSTIALSELRCIAAAAEERDVTVFAQIKHIPVMCHRFRPRNKILRPDHTSESFRRTAWSKPAGNRVRLAV